MAYTQKPGRSPFLKTGHGIPAPFKQTIDGPATTKRRIQVDKREATGYTNKEVKNATRFAQGAEGTGLMGNTQMSSRSGETEVKPYGNKLVEQPGGDMFMVNSSGKTIKSAKASKLNSTAIDKLKSEFESDKKSYNDYATANVIGQNATAKAGGGFKKPPLKQAKKVKESKYKGSTDMGSMGMSAGGTPNTDLYKVAKDYVGRGVKAVGNALGYRDTSYDDSRIADKIVKKK